jgi:hypothetical protein
MATNTKGTQVTVTRESLLAMLNQADDARKAQIIGRALVVVFRNQTASEQSSNTTNVYNGTGFAGMDAHGGCLTAKSFLKNGTLQPWQVDRWMKVGKAGFPRICKYYRQLEEAAQAKVAKAR